MLLLHDTRHDLPEIELTLAAQGYHVRSVAATAMRLQQEVDAWQPELILIAADDPTRDVMEQICVVSQFRERPIVMFTEADDAACMKSAVQAGVSAYVVAGLNTDRLHAVIDVALERFLLDSRRFSELAAARQQLEADRIIARAKALLAA